MSTKKHTIPTHSRTGNPPEKSTTFETLYFIGITMDGQPEKLWVDVVFEGRCPSMALVTDLADAEMMYAGALESLRKQHAAKSCPADAVLRLHKYGRGSPLHETVVVNLNIQTVTA